MCFKIGKCCQALYLYPEIATMKYIAHLHRGQMRPRTMDAVCGQPACGQEVESGSSF